MRSQDKKAFVLYHDDEKHIKALDDAQAGRLLKAVFNYSKTGEKPDFSDDGMLFMCFSFISAQMDRDADKYCKKCERNRENGKKGGRPKATDGKKEKQDEACESDENSKKRTVIKKADENAKEKAESNADKEADTDTPKEGIHKLTAREFADEYNSLCKSLAHVREITETRKKAIRSTVELLERMGMTPKEYFERIERSDFLCGRIKGREWRAPFDFVVKEQNVIKIIEGNYDNKISAKDFGTNAFDDYELDDFTEKPPDAYG